MKLFLLLIVVKKKKHNKIYHPNYFKVCILLMFIHIVV